MMLSCWKCRLTPICLCARLSERGRHSPAIKKPMRFSLHDSCR
jgi:hypothetical protein